MPLTAEIKINGNLIMTIWVGRLEVLRSENDSHLYATETLTSPDAARWMNATVVADSPTFYHRYSDGAAVCVKKAIETLNLCGRFKTEPGGN